MRRRLDQPFREFLHASNKGVVIGLPKDSEYDALQRRDREDEERDADPDVLESHCRTNVQRDD